MSIRQKREFTAGCSLSESAGHIEIDHISRHKYIQQHLTPGGVDVYGCDHDLVDVAALEHEARRLKRKAPRGGGHDLQCAPEQVWGSAPDRGDHLPFRIGHKQKRTLAR